jgi:hypothetical protein
VRQVPNPKRPATAPDSGVEFSPVLAKLVAAVAGAAIVVHLFLRFFSSHSRAFAEVPLYAALCSVVRRWCGSLREGSWPGSLVRTFSPALRL